MGPKRDLVGELAAGVRDKGIRLGLYYSLYEWYHPLWKSDKKRFVSEHLFPQFKDLIIRYRPDIVWSDGEWEMTSEEWRSPELLAWLFNTAPNSADLVINEINPLQSSNGSLGGLGAETGLAQPPWVTTPPGSSPSTWIPARSCRASRPMSNAGDGPPSVATPWTQGSGRSAQSTRRPRRCSARR